MSEPPRKARLTISPGEHGIPSVRLNDEELSGLLRADGFKIECDVDNDFNPGGFVVTMVFGAGKDEALDLDIDITLLRAMLAAKEAEAAS